ncbi:unnamed protein product [Microthlaspi erraticum]|uniref:Reverse transcriptase Ty1/copia-type domain-containing protein n=1 Tax=Microthlaspi erraticum TaxID=1685480 RepID=A0A6D2KTM1_9BRAS|nr:unnamed protein product [Microthlaspi erraticum]
MQAPTLAHWEAALRVVRYLKGSPGQGIFLHSDPDLTLIVYCDADYDSCPLTRRSLSAFVIMLGGSLVAWKTKKQVFDCVCCRPYKDSSSKDMQ